MFPLGLFIPPPSSPTASLVVYRRSQGADFSPASSDSVHRQLQGGGDSRRGAGWEGEEGHHNQKAALKMSTSPSQTAMSGCNVHICSP